MVGVRCGPVPEPAWAEQFNAALDGVVLPEPGPEAGLAATGGRFTVVQEVKATPDGDVSLVLRADQGSLRLTLTGPGPVGEGEPADDDHCPGCHHQDLL